MNESLDGFYSGEIALWRGILGPSMHYHHGLFSDPTIDPDEETMVAALRRAVSDLYPFIAPSDDIYDLGCGWGGPLSMLVQERGCKALGATIAQNQYRHVQSLGLPVVLANAEQTPPPRRFDGVLMMESFEHIRDKAALLRSLRDHAGKLVMRVNCQDASAASVEFGGTMSMISSSSLRDLLIETGWTIRHWRDCRAEAMPSFRFWHARVRDLPPSQDVHLEILRGWCAKLAAVGDEWGRKNPLIDLMAD